MESFWFETQTFKDDLNNVFNRNRAEIDGAFERLQREWKERVETDLTGIGAFESQMPGVTYLKLKKITSDYRPIVAKKIFDIDGIQYVCCVLVRFFLRSDTRYDNDSAQRNGFIHLSRGVRDMWCFPPDGRVDWDYYKNQIKIILDARRVPVELPELSVEERNFLNLPVLEAFTMMVYESKEWVKDVLNERGMMRANIANIRDSLIEEKDGVVSGVIWNDDEDGFFEIWTAQKTGVTIGYKLTQDGTTNFILLKFVPNGQDAEEVKREWERKISAERLKYDNDLLKTFRALSTRAYSVDLLDNADLWLEAEKSRQSNYILSGEENSLLETDEMPLFVKGRAGSGKSTVVQYLFCEYLINYLNSERDRIKKPVYISYSRKLIDSAKKMIELLFRNNTRYIERINGFDYEKVVKPLIDDCCIVFEKMEKNFLKTEEEKDRFAKHTYVTFSKFKKRWNERFRGNHEIWTRLDAELCWYVIRSFIKGWDSEKFLTPEDYRGIGGDNRTVLDEKYKLIYDKVWSGWYRDLTDRDGYWDDQDLVRYCLQNGYVEEKYSAVLCDEAQDYTRTELDLILKSSLYTHRSYEGDGENYKRKLPFIFAGDEFQTLNPTGFSWASVRAFLTERLRELRIWGGNDSGVQDPCTLKINFRSASAIVNLGNNIQLLREVRCGENVSEPQEAHALDTESVCWVDPTEENIQRLIDMNAQWIVPCVDGQTVEEYLKANNFPIPKESALNTMEAKGCGFPCVALYGFNTESLTMRNLERWFRNGRNQDADENIALRYELSNAYVAATRAENKLFIVSPKEEKSIWNFAFLPYGDEQQQKRVSLFQEKMLSGIDNDEKRNRWRNRLGMITTGDRGNFTNQPINPIEIAEEYERIALNTDDPSLFRKAAYHYTTAMNNTGDRDERAKASRKADYCNAKALYFEDNYFDAGELFAKHFEDYHNEAGKAFLAAYGKENRNDEVIYKLCHLNLNEKYRIIGDFAFILRRKTGTRIDTINSSLKELIQILQTDDELMSDSWKSIIDDVLKLCCNDNRIVAGKDDVKSLCDNCAKMERFTGAVDSQILTKIAFKQQDYDTVVSLWEGKKNSPEEYYRACAEIKPYPENLKYIKYPGNKDWATEILSKYRDNQSTQLSGECRKLVGSAVFETGSNEERMEFLPYMLSEVKTESDVENLLEKTGNSNLNKDVALLLFKVMNNDKSVTNIPKIGNEEYDNLLDIALEIAKVRAGALSNAIRGKDIQILDYFNGRYGNIHKREQNIFNDILLTEYGAEMEKMKDADHGCVNALRYYEWAIGKCTDEYKEAMKKRHVYITAYKDFVSADDEEKRAISDELRQFSSDFKFNRWEAAFRKAIGIKKQKVNLPNGKKAKLELPKTTGPEVFPPLLVTTMYGVGQSPEKTPEDGLKKVIETINENKSDDNKPKTGTLTLSGIKKDRPQESAEPQKEKVVTPKNTDHLFEENLEYSERSVFDFEGWHVQLQPKRTRLSKGDDSCTWRLNTSDIEFDGIDFVHDENGCYSVDNGNIILISDGNEGKIVFRKIGMAIAFKIR